MSCQSMNVRYFGAKDTCVFLRVAYKHQRRFQSSILIITSLSYIKVLNPKKKRKCKWSGSGRSFQYCFFSPERNVFTTWLENSMWPSLYSAMLDIVANCPAFLFPGCNMFGYAKGVRNANSGSKVHVFSWSKTVLLWSVWQLFFCGQMTARELGSI